MRRLHRGRYRSASAKRRSVSASAIGTNTHASSNTQNLAKIEPYPRRLRAARSAWL